jgi:hypothetical protein
MSFMHQHFKRNSIQALPTVRTGYVLNVVVSHKIRNGVEYTPPSRSRGIQISSLSLAK